MKTRLVALATVAFALTATGAAANETATNPFAKDKAILNLADLDLSTADGQQRLASRVDQAARTVCGDRLSGVHLAAEAKTQECRASVAADVRAQIEQRLARASTASGVKLASLR
ncbi:MAG: UrcA family protein [Sphingomonadales bacterium RIFCSPHIGHO2_01_FULL_65_20]|jgi:UrcA family protein|uniref:UrcA family protein n=1 Tax=Blastomonas TaxID=150203 RepID=UPI00083339E5|nr:UrcA family protein [Sphingomonas ursincola]MBA4778745.1 UrcA family protein [Blastomonas sp.]MBY0619648.1 UrcA family protein [Sphingomonas ursincola]MCH2237207.1 UrcA family protein [Blastomonas sp.]OHC92626.1 MAG: UrcA family protein [Sphingomonadales bacterium RIFCSPHIGHO2_01_FULL_65_20]